MKKLRLYPYKIYSKGAKNIVNVIGGKRVHADRKYVPKVNHLVVNWGNSNIPNWYRTATNRGVKILNNPIAVERATNKITTLRFLKAFGISHVPFTTNYDTAVDWINNGNKIIERHIINGTKANGVKVCSSVDELSVCPLYTKFISNAREYRVHVFKDEVIDVQQKKRRNREDDSSELISGHIKNLDSGWVFCRGNITEYPSNLESECVKAVKCLELDFGAVDVLVKNGTVFILEVNTACGMEGKTLLRYTNKIIKELQ